MKPSLEEGLDPGKFSASFWWPGSWLLLSHQQGLGALGTVLPPREGTDTSLPSLVREAQSGPPAQPSQPLPHISSTTTSKHSGLTSLLSLTGNLLLSLPITEPKSHSQPKKPEYNDSSISRETAFSTHPFMIQKLSQEIYPPTHPQGNHSISQFSLIPKLRHIQLTYPLQPMPTAPCEAPDQAGLAEVGGPQDVPG